MKIKGGRCYLCRMWRLKMSRWKYVCADCYDPNHGCIWPKCSRRGNNLMRDGRFCGLHWQEYGAMSTPGRKKFLLGIGRSDATVGRKTMSKKKKTKGAKVKSRSKSLPSSPQGIGTRRSKVAKTKKATNTKPVAKVKARAPMPAMDRKGSKGKQSGLTVEQTWRKMFDNNVDAKRRNKMTDKEILKTMQHEFPGRTSAAFSSVQGVHDSRMAYNRGKFSKGTVPEAVAVEFDKNGREAVHRNGRGQIRRVTVKASKHTTKTKMTRVNKTKKRKGNKAKLRARAMEGD